MFPEWNEHDAREPFYTNSTQLPVNYTDDVFEALELQDEIQTKYTGGTVFHVYAGERIEDPETVKNWSVKSALSTISLISPLHRHSAFVPLTGISVAKRQPVRNVKRPVRFIHGLSATFVRTGSGTRENSRNFPCGGSMCSKMKIGGFQKVSLLDYPGEIAAVVFCQGCNFRCPYCHNPELFNPELFAGCLSEKSILSFLRNRIGKLDAVTVTGGEPRIQKALPPFFEAA